MQKKKAMPVYGQIQPLVFVPAVGFIKTPRPQAWHIRED